MKPERLVTMMPTLDYWHPNHILKGHPSGLTDGVEVSFIELLPYRIKQKVYTVKWRVCVWGNDDCGMERDYENRDDAYASYTGIISWDTVDKDDLKKVGLVLV